MTTLEAARRRHIAEGGDVGIFDAQVLAAIVEVAHAQGPDKCPHQIDAEAQLRAGVDAQIAELLDESAGHLLAKNPELALASLDQAQDLAGAADSDESPIGLTWADMRALVVRDWDRMDLAYADAVAAGVA